MKYSISAALLALLPGVAFAAAPDVPLYKGIKAWVVGCDNTRQCTAVSAEEGTLDQPLTVNIVREAGPQGTLRVSISSMSDLSGGLLLDGKPLHSAMQKGAADQPDWSATGAQAQGLIDELRNAGRLSVSTTDGNASASLSGLSAALLLIDDMQGRLGSSTALIRRGDAPASAVPPAPPLPELPAFKAALPLGEAQAQQISAAVIKATKADWAEDDAGGIPVEGQAYALGEHSVLVSIRYGCGAYNCGYALYQASRVAPYTAQPVQVLDVAGGKLGGEPAGYVDFDPASGVLSSYNKGRGIGDCGISQSWQYDGARFVPRSLAQMDRCNGASSDYWPVLWRVGK